MVAVYVFYVAFLVVMIAAMWRVFEKAGKPGWAAIIPIYNLIVILEIVGKPLYWFILMLIPGLNVIFSIWTLNLLSKSFGKDEGFTIGLLLLGIVFYPILGFGPAKYIGPAGQPMAPQRHPDALDRDVHQAG